MAFSNRWSDMLSGVLVSNENTVVICSDVVVTVMDAGDRPAWHGASVPPPPSPGQQGRQGQQITAIFSGTADDRW